VPGTFKELYKDPCGFRAYIRKSSVFSEILFASILCQSSFFPCSDVQGVWDGTVFLCTKFDGNVQESEEMRPEWFDCCNLPFSQMWADDKYWSVQSSPACKHVKALFQSPINSFQPWVWQKPQIHSERVIPPSPGVRHTHEDSHKYIEK
jgi:hypothetical protein